jgi:hypothetical protein
MHFFASRSLVKQWQAVFDLLDMREKKMETQKQNSKTCRQDQTAGLPAGRQVSLTCVTCRPSGR